MAQSTYIDDYDTLSEYLIDCGEHCFETTVDRLNYGDIILVATAEDDNPNIIGRVGVFAGFDETGQLLLRAYPTPPRPTGDIDVDTLSSTTLPYQTPRQENPTRPVDLEATATLIIIDAKHDPDLAYSNWDLDRVAADLQQILSRDLTMIQVPDSPAFFDVKSKALLLVKDLADGAGLLLLAKKSLTYASKLVAWRLANPQRARD